MFGHAADEGDDALGRCVDDATGRPAIDRAMRHVEDQIDDPRRMLLVTQQPVIGLGELRPMPGSELTGAKKGSSSEGRIRLFGRCGGRQVNAGDGSGPWHTQAAPNCQADTVTRHG